MNIYVGNISRMTTEEKIKSLFAQFGEVTSVKLIKDKFTGELKGFGFVEMPNTSEASAAIAQLNGQDVDGQRLRINEARPREEGGFSSRGPRPMSRGPRFNRY
jgi:RNA recognition motif-containing protein